MAGPAGGKDLPAWYKEMEKDLECPVCLVSFLDPPIYVCENQHGLCSACRTKLNDKKKPCPVCNGKLTDKRNLIVEKILDRLPGTKCIYPECSFKRADRKAVLDHQEDCGHRKAPCVSCGESMAMSSLNQHLTTKHDEEIHSMVTRNWVWDLSSHSTEQQIMQGPKNTPLNGVIFYLNTMALNDNTMWWVSYNGPKKDRRKYQFSIEVLDLGDPMKVALSGTKFCVPCDTAGTVVKEKYLGVFINDDLAKEVSIGENPNSPTFRANVQVFLTRPYK